MQSIYLIQVRIFQDLEAQIKIFQLLIGENPVSKIQDNIQSFRT